MGTALQYNLHIQIILGQDGTRNNNQSTKTGVKGGHSVAHNSEGNRNLHETVYNDTGKVEGEFKKYLSKQFPEEIKVRITEQ